MIIGKDTEYQTLFESIDYDIANALDYYNNDIDWLKAELYPDEVPDDNSFIPMEYIPTELIGVDTDNMTEDQEEMLREAKSGYIVDYMFWWRDKVTELKRAQREEEESRWHGFNDIRTEYGEIYYNGMVIDEEDFEDFAWDEYSAEAEDNDECPCEEYFDNNLKPEWFRKVLDKYCATLNQ